MRLLFWNIENFSVNKVNDPNANPFDPYPGTTISRNAASVGRLNYIISHVQQAAPDVIVIVEVEAGWGLSGTVCTGNGLAGLIVILNALRVLNADWMLVPPLRTGGVEAVAVFYRSTNRFYTGPYRWPGGGGAVAVAPPNVTGAYPDELNTAITGGRAVPNGALYNATVQENVCAARTTFTHSLGTGNAGNAYDFGASRSPYMATFAETNLGGAVVRNVTLFGVHAPATYDAAVNYLGNELTDVAQITDGIGGTEVRVVVGDFNVNLIHSDDNTFNATYDQLEGNGYDLALRPNPLSEDDPPDPPEGYQGYFATHMRPAVNALFWSKIGDPGFYPRYGYTGAAMANYFAIDNIYTAYGANVNRPANDRFTILNGVTGSPFNLIANPGGEPPTGTLAFNSVMANLIVQAIAPDHQAGMGKQLRGWNNYLRIRSTSDHIAIVMDI